MDPRTEQSQGWLSERTKLVQIGRAAAALEKPRFGVGEDLTYKKEDKLGREYTRLTEEGKRQMDELWKRFEMTEGRDLNGWERSMAVGEFWQNNRIVDKDFARLARRDFEKRIYEQEFGEFITKIEEDENSSWHEAWENLKEKYPDKRRLKAAGKRLFEIREEVRNTVVDQEDARLALLLEERVAEEMGLSAEILVEKLMDGNMKKKVALQTAREQSKAKAMHKEMEALQVVEAATAEKQTEVAMRIWSLTTGAVFILAGFSDQVRWLLKDKENLPSATIVEVAAIPSPEPTETATVTATVTATSTSTSTVMPNEEGERLWRRANFGEPTQEPELAGPPPGPDFHPDYIVGGMNFNLEDAQVNVQVSGIGVDFTAKSRANYDTQHVNEKLYNWFETFSDPKKLLVLRTDVDKHMVVFIHSGRDMIYGGVHIGDWIRSNDPETLVGQEMQVTVGEGENFIKKSGQIIDVREIPVEQWEGADDPGDSKYDPTRLVLGREKGLKIGEDGRGEYVEMGLGLPEVARQEDQITFVACSGYDPNTNEWTTRVLVTVDLEK